LFAGKHTDILTGFQTLGKKKMRKKELFLSTRLGRELASTDSPLPEKPINVELT
jgi:hypothetical protein